jgi:squalene-hopene/tetraprenyl-beta-curcumene cyclase
MRHLSAIVTLAVLPFGALAADPAPNVKKMIDRGLAFLTEDGLAWKDTRRCASCHHAPFTVWALSEAKKQGYAVDEKALAGLIAWVAAKDDPAKVFGKSPQQEPIVVNEAPLLLALGIEAGEAKAPAAQDGLKKMLAALLSDQNKDGSWKLVHASRPIGSAPDVMTTLALLALSAPNAPDLGTAGKAAREKGLQWLRGAKPDDDQQATVLRLILWRRLGRPASDWEPLVNKLRVAQNADGGWGQTKGAKSDAYATGQALYALAEAGERPGDEAVRRAQSFLAKIQGPDGSWAMTSRAILPSGKRAKNLEPITHAGSAWAVLGLVRTAATPRPNPATK